LEYSRNFEIFGYSKIFEEFRGLGKKVGWFAVESAEVDARTTALANYSYLPHGHFSAESEFRRRRFVLQDLGGSLKLWLLEISLLSFAR
jgi:hypothetical protein